MVLHFNSFREAITERVCEIFVEGAGEVILYATEEDVVGQGAPVVADYINP